ncbi:NAD-dependent epimerase/dehydratase family protein [Pseudomonas sp. PDM18]|uniref:NAD-dependent epimerase/dehydratase family protein n=1 Tax=unclassified Pseudomonas TaxID=196821 RepID=UPI00177C5907|nr:NAD-dependent epimerase/dehydratase family protein [Pseudomonas sp. PDM18]MBD9678444.1 NAD-dependent epimerase/dehydratase family protein [Pseudomonas sp. PDM18]
MKVLVLGVHGFIGRHIATLLGQQGHEIVGADIPLAGTTDCLSIHPEKPDFEALFQQEQPDACINCTGAASVPDSFTNPLNDYTLNTVRIAQTLEAIRKVSAHTRFIHFSSAAVYGNPSTSLPIRESDGLSPVSPYGWHKRSAEEVCQEYAQLFGTQSISLRVFSAYGPHLRKQLFWDIYQKSLHQPCIELFGTGRETRDFIYVADIAHALNVLLHRGDFDGRAVNVASGTASTIRTAATTLLDALGVEKEVVFTGNERTGDPSYWQADVSYLRSLGFTPQFELQSGLGHVADWLKTL